MQKLIGEPVGNNMINREDDVRSVKNGLSDLNRFQEEENNGYITRDLDTSIRTFQRDHNLKEDGLLFPNGETEEALVQGLAQRRAGQQQGFPRARERVRKTGNPEDSDGEAQKGSYCDSLFESLHIERIRRDGLDRDLERILEQKNDALTEWRKAEKDLRMKTIEAGAKIGLSSGKGILGMAGTITTTALQIPEINELKNNERVSKEKFKSLEEEDHFLQQKISRLESYINEIESKIQKLECLN